MVVSLLLSTTPRLCVKPDSLAAKELVPALRARLARRALLVTVCTPGAEALWQVNVKPLSQGKVRVLVEGDRCHFELDLDVEGQSMGEVTQLAALKAAEAVRPAVDAVFAELGLPESEPPEREAALAALDAEEVAAVEVSAPSLVEVKPVSPRLDFEVVARGVFGVPFVAPAGGARLSVGLGTGPVRLSLGASALFPTTTSQRGVSLLVSQIDLGFGVDLRLPAALELGLHAFAQRALVRVTTQSPAVDGAVQDYWAFLPGLHLGWWPVQWKHASLGAALEGSLVWRPRTFLLDGEPLLNQALFQATLSVGIRWMPFSSSAP